MAGLTKKKALEWDRGGLVARFIKKKRTKINTGPDDDGPEGHLVGPFKLPGEVHVCL